MVDLLSSVNPLAFNVFIALASLIVLVKSANYIVLGISNYAKEIGLSDYLISFIVVSIGTAMPELVASITGALMKEGMIVFGTVLGSSLFKIPTLGIALIIVGTVKYRQSIGSNTPYTTFVLSLLPMVLVIDGKLSRIDGAILLLSFVWYIGKLWSNEKKFGSPKRFIKFAKIWKHGLVFLFALTAVLLSARWLVSSSLFISHYLNISPYIIGLIVIGVGASTPELSVQITSMKGRHKGLAFGNVLGSVVCNSVFVLGIVSLLKPVSIKISGLLISIVFLAIGIILATLVMSKGNLTRKHGIYLVIFYILFLIAELLFS